ncbi:hypothetical protein [Umezawaea beigongshangensis]|uniref:hypothetical protein n=1 Tax=Umezawaea beigongshangensis TaxID=2780383 RepID=UPI0018F18A09|nr:hypothetical protein [Umezawaea beigongshangensis]
MRAVAAVLVAAAILTACSSHHEEDVRFTVTRISPPGESMGKPVQAHVVMDVAQDENGLGLMSPEGADLDQFPEGTAVGDTVVCTVTKTDDNGFDGVDPKTTIGPCRRP